LATVIRFITFSFLLSLLSSYQGCRERPYSTAFYNEKVTVDGADNEKVWAKCIGYTKFLNPWENELAQGTAFKSFNDQEYLYFHFNMDDSLILCHEDENNDTAVEYSDRVELFFAMDPLMSEYCGLEFDACGRLQQFYSKGHRTFVHGWKFPALQKEDYAVVLSSTGYKIEGRLSLKGLRQMGFINDGHIYMGVFRADRKQKNNWKDISWISWKDIDTPKPDFHTFKGFEKVEIAKQ